jgi:hypothetical protein
MQYICTTRTRQLPTYFHDFGGYVFAKFMVKTHGVSASYLMCCVARLSSVCVNHVDVFHGHRLHISQAPAMLRGAAGQD